MGAGGEDLVRLVENPSARPAGRHAGHYPFALLHPSRLELSRALRRLAVTRTPIQGASDHAVSEAVYLSDPDGNGIELYRDRPRDEWRTHANGEIVLVTEPLDLDDVLAVAGDEQDVPCHADRGLTMGHVHLHANDLRAAVGFHRDVLGFDAMTTMPSAAFLSAGGYHHHLGLNVWRGEGIPGAPGDDVVGLREWNLVVETPEELDAITTRLDAAGAPVERDGASVLTRDPAGIPVRLSASSE
jgi:catechol 2,3-dioxygenase